MLAYWLIPAFALAALQWYARWREQRRLHWVSKPAVIVVLILWVWQITRFEDFTLYVGLALALSLLGDVFLMLPPSFFLPGLAAFLLAHVSYMAGFWLSAPEPAPLLWLTGAAILSLMVYNLHFYWQALRGKPVSKKVKAGVMVYIIVIFCMLFSAASTFWQPGWLKAGAALVYAGAVFFAVSDSLLARNQFVSKFRHAGVWVMLTYHLAQIAICAGVIWQFINP